MAEPSSALVAAEYVMPLTFALAQLLRPNIDRACHDHHALLAALAIHRIEAAARRLLAANRRALSPDAPQRHALDALYTLLRLVGAVALWLAGDFAVRIVAAHASAPSPWSLAAAFGLLATPYFASMRRLGGAGVASPPPGATVASAATPSAKTAASASEAAGFSFRSPASTFRAPSLAAAQRVGFAPEPPLVSSRAPDLMDGNIPLELIGFRRHVLHPILKPFRDLFRGDKRRGDFEEWRERDSPKMDVAMWSLSKRVSSAPASSDEMAQVALAAKNQELISLNRKNDEIRRHCTEGLDLLDELVRSHALGSNEMDGGASTDALLDTARRVQRLLKTVVVRSPENGQGDGGGATLVAGSAPGWVYGGAAPAAGASAAGGAGGCCRGSHLASRLGASEASPGSSPGVSPPPTWCSNDDVRMRLYGSASSFPLQ